MFECLGSSILAVVLAEMGDKTQLLALLLATKFRKPVPIILGILVATLLNHGMAGALGAWITSVLTPDVLRWILAISFIGMGIWMLIPDKEDGASIEHPWIKRMGVFGATFITFFLAEMGDKTQIATVGLAMHYSNALLVVIGTTIGMLIADVPAIWAGEKFSEKIPMNIVHWVAAFLFFILGILAFLV